MDGGQKRQVNFLAPVIAAAIAPAAGAAIRAAMPRVTLAEVACPRCNRVPVLLVLEYRRLFSRARDGGIGAPLGTRPRENVAVRCDHCRVTWHTSGAAVFRKYRDGRPLLALAAGNGVFTIVNTGLSLP